MRFAPLVGVMTVIFLLSHIPGHNLPKSAILTQDRLCHALAYATLAAAALWAWWPQVKRRPRAGLGAILLFCLVFGISDEFHQSFIAGRYSSLSDIAADVVGAALFLGLWRLWYARRD